VAQGNGVALAGFQSPPGWKSTNDKLHLIGRRLEGEKSRREK